jgi:SAM-dependent methyltransferase
MNTSAGPNGGNLEILNSGAQEIEHIEHIVNRQFADRSIDVLDAGCGRKWLLHLNMPYKITGVDADEAALAQRTDLDVALLKDVQTVQMPKNQFDLIYCSFVLEHVVGAERLLRRFVDWLRPGGLLVLRFPDKYTVFGFITRNTPYRLHVAYKKHLLERQHAGVTGHGPYPTVYDDVVSRKGMWKFCQRQQLTVLGEWGRNTSLPRRGKFLWMRKQMVRAVELLSMNKLDSSYSQLTFVIRKPD